MFLSVVGTRPSAEEGIPKAFATEKEDSIEKELELDGGCPESLRRYEAE